MSQALYQSLLGKASSAADFHASIARRDFHNDRVTREGRFLFTDPSGTVRRAKNDRWRKASVKERSASISCAFAPAETTR